MSRDREDASIVFPTPVKAEDGIIQAFAPRPVAKPEKRTGSDGELYGYLRTNIDGLRAILAATAVEHGDGERSGDGNGWCGTATRADALQLSLDGWTEVLPAMTEQMDRMKARITRTLIPVVEYADEPGTPDVAAYLTGEDEYFVLTSEGRQDTPAVGRAVRILMEPCVSAGISTEAMVQRGAVVGAVIHTLERAGVRVALEFCSCIGPDGETVQIEVVLKSFGEPFDVRGLAFWLAHPSSSRRFIFDASYYTAGVRPSGFISWGNRVTAADDEHTVVVGRHTTFEDGGRLESWVERALKVAGISLEGE